MFKPKLCSLFTGFFLLLCPLSLQAGTTDFWRSPYKGTVPKAAIQIVEQIDAQLMRRVGDMPNARNGILIISTVSVSLNDLEESNPLSRQISEEIVNILLAKGYRANEVRKGKEIVMHQRQGEMILTRKVPQLAEREVTSVAVLAGTYLVTPDHIRFNMRLLSTPTSEVLAMGSATVPVTDEVRALLRDRKKGPPQPSVYTRLP